MKNLHLPATEKRKQFELRALGLRDFAGVRNEQALDPFALARVVTGLPSALTARPAT